MSIRKPFMCTVLAVAIQAALLPSLFAQDVSDQAVTNDNNAKSNDAVTLHAVTVTTGTNQFDRTVATSLAPIDVLTPADLKATGATNLTSALSILIPSINFPPASVSDASDATQAAQLRGLSPDQVLVLINGKRQHVTSVTNVIASIGNGSSPVDFAAIPLNAVDRIEVLRDGAAAQYGSDAIAGVVNIILKGGAKGGTASVTGGQFSKGDGATWQEGADGGFPLGQDGWVHLTANLLHRNPNNRAGPDLREPGASSFGKVTFHLGIPLTKQKQAAINLQYKFSPQVELYAFSIFNKRNVDSGGFFRELSSYADSPAALAIYPEGYLPVLTSAIRDDTEVLGFRGTVADWHYDVSANTGGSHWKIGTKNSFNYDLGSSSPTRFYAGTTTLRQNVFNADFSRPFTPAILNNPLTVSWGLEYRQETYGVKNGEFGSYFNSGSQGFGGFAPGDAGTYSRHSTGEYIDLETDLTAKLSAGLAARHENYSDFGSNNSAKLSGRFEFNDLLAMRGTVSTGFRAPALQQEHFSQTSTASVQLPSGENVLETIRTFPVNDPAAIALGAKPLRAEKSRSYSLGWVLTPSNGLFATLDLYQVTINHSIQLSGYLTGDDVESYLTSVGIPFVQGGDFFNNAIDLRTRGADLIVTYPFQFDSSSLKFTGGLNYNRTEVLSIEPNPPQLGLVGLTLPIMSRYSIRNLEQGAPRNKLFVAADWTIGPWQVHGQVTRYGQFVVPSNVPSLDQTFPSRYLLDLNVAYGVGHWKFTIGANNVNNVYPQKVASLDNSVGGNLQYPLSSPFGYDGAYYYGTVAFNW